MAQLSLTNINKIYGNEEDGVHIIKNANLEIENQEFVVFVGPSGCGKSTMLRMIAGLEDITSGELKFDNEVVNDLSPAQRGIGMVFQSYALYPHMTVRENIAFGLKFTRKDWDKKKQEQAVEEVADVLELTTLLDRKPSQMSGGQRQRVAIGRALVRQPKVFLLDEPLSNLDAAMRVRMRGEIAKFHKQFKPTIIYVTHDQVEAMTLADKVVVLNKGNVEQVGSPLELYHFPATEFVARFIGSPKMNFVGAQFLSQEGKYANLKLGSNKIHLEANAHNLASGEKLTIGIRPEDVHLGDQSDIPVIVNSVEFLGAESILFTQFADEQEEFLVRCPGTMDVKTGQKIFVKIPDKASHLFINGKALPRTVTKQDLLTQPIDS